MTKFFNFVILPKKKYEDMKEELKLLNEASNLMKGYFDDIKEKNTKLKNEIDKLKKEKREIQDSLPPLERKDSPIVWD